MVPHTHTDLGWLKTIQEYYKSHVKEILDSVVANLWFNNRKYVFHDVGFIELWWKDATESQKTKFRNLVKIGLLEIVNGSISMNDLATTRIFESETNFYHGHSWCKENLGVSSSSKTAWMIDPFGIPKSQFQLLHNMGFRNLVLNRIPFNQKDERKEQKRLTFWAADPL